MIKDSNTSIKGTNVLVGDLLMNRLIPADSAQSVGPFLLLDHSYPVLYKGEMHLSQKLNEHPHRGLLAFTYVIDGEVEHFDSLGNHETVGEGGANWLSSGNGVMHAERVSERLIRSVGTFHAVQFWINMPSDKKSDPPKYKLLNVEAFPVLQLPDHCGTLSILLGKSGSTNSPVDSLSGEFLFRIKLNPKSEFEINIPGDLSRAVFVPNEPLFINGDLVGQSELFIPESRSREIALRNPGILPVDAFILGGPEPTEPVVVQGPFAMSSQSEIAAAYRDFFAGKYGMISKL